MDILEEIVAYKRQEIAERQMYVPMHQLWELVRPRLDDETSSMSRRLRQSPTGLIAEFKRKSPSLGWIHQDAKAADITLGYQRGGATAVSILTDTHYFGGYDEFVQQARVAGLSLPVLYKNFIIDEYQIFEARMLGADAVLLIARILSPAQLLEYAFRAWEIGLDVLVEVHDEADMRAALATPAEFIGINNRNLQTFTTSIENTLELLPRAEESRTFISESGIFSAADARRLQEAGCGGILVGEGLVRADDVAEMTRRLAEPCALAKESA